MYSLGAPARVAGFMRFFFFAVISLVFTFCLTLTAHAAAVGATPGSFSVSNSGRATYTIPLTLPPGINGVQPSLALRYQSGSGNGLLGLGWSISGLSVIHRCDQTIAQNGQIHGVDYSTDDRLCLNGNQLRVVSGSYWSSSAVYRTERERFVRITQHGSGVNAWFEVEYKNGRRAEFGHSPDSAINAASGSGIDGIRLWAINRLADRNGNAVVYHYTEDTANGGYRPSRIEYTVSHGAAAFYQIHFDYDTDRPDSIEGYLGGSERTQTARLSAIRIETTSNAPVRRYTLAYEIASAVHQSRLLSVTECAGANWSRCLRPTTFDWGAGAKGWEITANDGYESHLLDLNGDGYKDLIYRQSGQWKLRWGGANGFTAERATGLADNTTYYGPSKLIVDHNGDGHQELLLPEADREGDWYLLGYGANGLYRTNTGMPTIINERTKKSVDVVRVVDINGDGRSDLLRAEESAEELAGESGLWVWLGVDTGWEKQPIWDLGFPVYVVKMQDPNAPMHLPSLGTFEWMQTGDINADGLSDFLIPCIIDCPGGEPTAVKILSSVTGYQITPSRYSRGALLVDINADGADGVLYKSDEGDWYIAKSNGQDFMAGQRIATSVGYRAKAVDYNADGLTDVLLTTLDSRSVVIRSPEDPSEPERIETNHFRGKEMYVLLSNGQTLTNVGKLNITLPRAESTTDKVTFKDLDNDGLAELVSSIRGVNTFYWHKPSQANLLVGITNGFGNHYSINYKQLTDPANYTRAGDSQKPAYPQKAYTGARKVVASYTADDGTGGTYTVSYHYSDARVNLLGRGLLGFAKRTVTDSRKPGVIVTETFRQDYPFTGFTLNKTLTAPDGNPISVTIITPEKKILSVAGDPQRVFVYPKKTIDKSYALGNNTLLKTTTTTINGMGDWGNPQSINTTVIGNGKTFTTTKTLDYLINQSTWCIGKPDSTSITRTLPNGDTHTQTTTAIIDPVSCRAKSQTLQAAGSNPAVITAYQFDSWGNVSQTTISAQGVASRITKADYQAYQGRFPATLTNAAGHSTTLTWDTALGLKESVTGPNDLTTGFDYDAFGRLIHTNYPDARAITLTYDWCGVDGCGVDGGTYKISQSQATGAQAVSVYDAFGRVIKTASRGLHGAWTYQYTQYGALGHIAKQSQPYQSGTVYWTQYQYDLLGRVVTVQHPYNPNSGAGGGQTTTDYSGFTTTVTNANGQVSQKFDNAIGQTIKVVDALNNVTRYAYDAAGNLIKTTDPLGNVILMDYDNRGNKIAMDDPDMGHWSYDYNAFGELIKQTDAKGQITTMDYDVLGRMVARVEGAGSASPVTANWTYGTVNTSAEKNIGKLVSVTQSTGFTKVISYDQLSRPVETVVTLNGVDYKTNTAYDQYSRVTAIQYPYSLAGINHPVNAVARVADTSVVLGSNITLDGSDSTDADSYQTLSYQWTQTSGSSTPITGTTAAMANISPDQPGSYTFQLTVSDGTDSATDSVTVTVAPAPVGSLTISDGAQSHDGSYTLSWATPAGGLPANSEYRLFESGSPDFSPEQLIGSGATRNQSVSGKGNGTWNYRVVVCHTALCSTDVTADVLVELPPGTPGTPTISDGAVSTDGDYTVAWNPPASGQYTGYVLHETPGTPATLAPGIESTTQSNQANDTTYTYQVEVCNGSACTTSGSRSVKVIIPPGAPASLSVPNSSADGVETISWGAASGDVDYYQLQEATTTSFSTLTHNWTQSSTSRSVTLNGNDTWYYRVRACNTYSNTTRCSSWRTDTTGLRNDELPGSISAPVISDGSVSTDGSYTLQWSKPAGLVTGYVLIEDPGTGEWTVSAGTLSKARSGRANDTTYSYRVKACNHSVCTTSGVSSIKVVIPPSVPTSISVPNSSADGTETISWGAASGDVDYYQLQESKSSGFGTLTHNWTQSSTARSVTVSGNDTWYYRVRACNTYSNTTRCSGWRTDTTGLRNDELPGSISAPTITDGTVSTDGSYTVNWSAPSGHITGYVLLENPGNGQWSVSPGTRSKALSGRSNDATYSYQVKACQYTACTTSGARSIKVVILPARPASISVPNSTYDGAETISWGASSGAADYYQLQESKSTGFGTLTHNWTQSSTSRSITLNGNDTWYYRVRACNTYSNTTRCSGWRTDTTGLRNYEKPGAPTGISASFNTSAGSSMTGQMSVTWGAASSGTVDHYELYRRQRTTVFDTTWSGWSHVTDTASRSHSAMVTNGIYQYRVRACNPAGCSAYTGSSEIDGTSGGGYKCPPFCGAEAHHKPAPATAATMPQPMQVASATAYGFHAQLPARPYDLAQLAHKLNRHSRAGGHPSLALSPTFPVGAASYAANARAQKTSYTQNRYANNAYVSTLKASGDGSGYRFTVKYTYGQYGHLTQVENYNSGKVYWQATASDARGHITDVQLGNGITTSRVYDPATGYLTSIASTLMSTGDIQYQTYSWDPLGNLTRRHWEIGSLNPTSHTEDFYYDNMNRLTRTVLDNVVTQTIAYNALGNISSKTGQGAYTYGQGMQYGNAGIHAVTSVGSDTYTYDANGNMTSGNGRQIIWNAANYPVQITQGATSKTFEYGPAKQRYLQHRYTNGALTQTMITIGGLFQRTENYTSGKITYQHYIRAAGKTIAIHTRTNSYTQKIEYLHRDHLGSIVAITNADGDVIARMSYDAFGARRQLDGQGPANNPLSALERGFTGHQMLDKVGLIHMNGRVYDPAIGRFLSADPLIQAPYNSQSYNRYSYVWNNPLSNTDPSGFVTKEGGGGSTSCGDMECLEENHGEELDKAKDVAKGLEKGYGVVVFSDGSFAVVKISSSPQAMSETSRATGIEGVERETGGTVASDAGAGVETSNVGTGEQKSGKFGEIISETKDLNSALAWDSDTGIWTLYKDGKAVDTGMGYAGGNKGENPEGINNPRLQGVENIGPPPAGVYVAQQTIRSNGVMWVRMWPSPTNQMYGRTEFFIHGDALPLYNASQGCLIMQINDRRQIRTGTMIWID